MTSIQKEFLKLQIATVALFLVIVAVVIYVLIDGHNRISDIKRGQAEIARTEARIDHGRFESRLAICQELNLLKKVHRDSIEKKILDGKAFLKANPHGIPGISPELIRADIKDNEDLLDDLAATNCQKFATNPEKGLHP